MPHRKGVGNGDYRRFILGRGRGGLDGRGDAMARSAGTLMTTPHPDAQHLAEVGMGHALLSSGGCSAPLNLAASDSGSDHSQWPHSASWRHEQC